jgi:L-threonylcarbamoyladenylate synthase
MRKALLRAGLFYFPALWQYVDMTEAKILTAGGVGIVPTDTLYGICASALSKRAVERVYRLKGRDEGKPFITLISSADDLKLFGVKLSAEQKEYLASVWPGPVSVILPVVLKKFAYLHRGTNSIAFRLPKNPKLQKFLQESGPLAAPSANPQGLLPARTVAEAKKYFGDAVDFYIAGGTKDGKPSKIVSLVSGAPEVLRA